MPLDDDPPTGRDQDAETPERSPPEDTFALVGNEIRASIVQTLGDARGKRGSRPVLSFSELRERVDVEVRSSQFNYHLQQLVGRFVESMEDGYRMRPEGTTLYRTIHSETFDRQESLGPFEVGMDCYFCGSPVEATYENGGFAIQCSDCDHWYSASTRLPPGSFSDEDDLLDRFDRHDRHKLLAFSRGVCPTCANDLDTDLVRAEESALSNTDQLTVHVVRSCDHCNNQDYRTVGESLLQRPEITSFCYERGLDHSEHRLWELAFAATDRCVTVESEDPWRVAFGLELDGDVLELVVDDEMTVVERRRS